jgi:DNA adenine methylase
MRMTLMPVPSLPRNFCHLYEIRRTANLSERFDQVDIEATRARTLSTQTFAIHPNMKFIVTSREWFKLLQGQDPKGLTDIQRAARFFYLQKIAYAGLVRHRDYGYSVEEPSRFNPERIPELLENTHKRLARVQIECLPYQEILKRYDRPTTLFYLDPPYFGRKLYNFNFTELAKRLEPIHGKFVLSLNDVPEVRRIFRQFHFREIDLAYTAQKTAGKRFRELLITNYRLPQPKPEVKP